MPTYRDFVEALTAFRAGGGALNHLQATSESPECWEIADPLELEERITCSAREATEAALRAGGLGDEQIADELYDWCDPEPVTIYVCSNAEMLGNLYAADLDQCHHADVALAACEAAARVIQDAEIAGRPVRFESAPRFADWNGGRHYQFGWGLGQQLRVHCAAKPQWLVSLLEAAYDAMEAAGHEAAAQWRD